MQQAGSIVVEYTILTPVAEFAKAKSAIKKVAKDAEAGKLQIGGKKATTTQPAQDKVEAPDPCNKGWAPANVSGLMVCQNQKCKINEYVKNNTCVPCNKEKGENTKIWNMHTDAHKEQSTHFQGGNDTVCYKGCTLNEAEHAPENGNLGACDKYFGKLIDSGQRCEVACNEGFQIREKMKRVRPFMRSVFPPCLPC